MNQSARSWRWRVPSSNNGHDSCVRDSRKRDTHSPALQRAYKGASGLWPQSRTRAVFRGFRFSSKADSSRRARLSDLLEAVVGGAKGRCCCEHPPCAEPRVCVSQRERFEPAVPHPLDQKVGAAVLVSNILSFGGCGCRRPTAAGEPAPALHFRRLLWGFGDCRPTAGRRVLACAKVLGRRAPERAGSCGAGRSRTRSLC